MHSVRLVNAAMPWLETSDRASITLSPRVSGREVDFTGPGYAVMKTALVRYAQDLAYKLAPKMIRANTVSPGNTYFDGGIWQWIEANNPTLYAESLGSTRPGGWRSPRRSPGASCSSRAPASSFTTGTNLVTAFRG